MKESEIREKVEKLKGWYQAINIGDVRTIPESDLRASIRTDSVLKFIPQVVRPDDGVIDIGCNAGLHSMAAGQICKEVLGVDISEKYVEQANFIKSVWKQGNVSNVTFRACNILKELELINNFDVVFALKLLYHRGFVEGIDDFMNAVRKSKVRLILAQGHVKQPRRAGKVRRILARVMHKPLQQYKFRTTESMTELFNKYDFDVVVLEDIPEYPIVLAIRKGAKMSDGIKPIKNVTRDIEFHKDFDANKHTRCIRSLKNIDRKNVKFDEYREAFERCVVEVGIMRGTLGSIQPVPIAPSPLEDTKFGEMMGVNEHTNRRVQMAREFFDSYEKYGRKHIRETKFYKESKLSWFIKRRAVSNILRLYENMKIIKNLVPNARDKKIGLSVFHPEDFPWSINYSGYIKKRDGSHRRMIMSYFGAKTVDEIVVDFEKISEEDLRDACPYLRNNFNWFREEVIKARRNVGEG